MKVHFIGIGGIGVSSLAHYFISQGSVVTGSDMVDSETIVSLKKAGAKIFIGGHLHQNIDNDTDLVIYSPAVTEDNPEIKKAKEMKIEIKSYPEALGDLTKKYFTIAVSGTHGKSTTTAMLALIMIEAGLDPTVIIGTKLKEFNGLNFRKGNSNYLLIEADEYKESFLNYRPNTILVTNIDKDHLDYYGKIENILSAFKKFFSLLVKDGFIVANGDDPNTVSSLSGFNNITFYNQNQAEAGKIKKILKVPGEHNLSNGLAAYTVARQLKIPEEIILSALSKFRGTWRRFDVFDTGYKKITLVSDYAHHPTEVKKTLIAAGEKYPKRRVIALFQPHQYKRTRDLFDDFIEALKNPPVDKVVLMDIYQVAGREDKEISDRVSSSILAQEAGDRVIYKKDAGRYLKRSFREGDVFLMMGAGDIYHLFLEIKNYFLDKKAKEKDN